MIITIDGPSGSGKTTLALLMAKELHFFCMNSGYLYRGLAYILKNFYGYDEQKMHAPAPQDIRAIFQTGQFEYRYEYGLTKIIWGGADISIFLKDPEISKMAAMIAKDDVVRELVHDYERKILAGRDVVVEGRACGSVIYPHAEIKFYIDASQNIRADRLQRDQLKRGKELTYEQALQQIAVRDEMDKNRPLEPLVIPDGAIILDSTEKGSDELLQKCLKIVKQYLHKKMD